MRIAFACILFGFFPCGCFPGPSIGVGRVPFVLLLLRVARTIAFFAFGVLVRFDDVVAVS